MATIPTTIELDEATRHRIDAFAARHHESASAVLQQALNQFFERADLQKSFLEDSLAALDEYETTGLHLTQTEAEDWLLKLEAGEDAPMPQCHT